MVNKILIRKSDRKTLHKDRRTLGMNGENLQEVLLFCLDEKIEGTGIVEVELPNGEKGMIQVERTEEGYELPIKSSLMAQTGFVKFQLRILHNEVEIFKSEIIALEVKDSINATATIPEEYPSWVDTLTNLKKDLEKAESERVSNENERISAEKTRQENFTKMQKTVENATSNIKDLKEDYNENAKQKTEEFNKNFEEKQKAINDNAEAKTTAFGENAEAQTKTFNTNSDDKLAEYNRNHTAKMKEFDDNYDTKTKTFDDNAAAKLDKYNKNTELKEKSFNDNAGTKTETFNSNAADKQNEFDENASDKLAEYNQNAKELINKVEQVQAENETLKAENKLIKEQIPSASASGNSIHVEDSGSLELEWKLRSEHYQKQTIQNDNLLILEDTTITTNGITLVIKDGVITINGNSIASTNIDFKIKKKLKAGTYWHMVQRSGSAPSGNVGFLVMKSGGSIASINGRGGATFTLKEDTEVFYRIWTDKNNTISNVVYKCIISEGSDSKAWWQGIPDSPSLDYPSEIETVGSNVNELKLKNGKSIKAYGLDVSIDNGIITINGTANEYYPTFLISGDGEIETRLGVPNINANPNWYNSIALAKRDYTLKFEYISGDGGTAYRPYVFIHTSDGKNSEFSQGNSTKIKNYTGEIDGISFYVDKNQTFNNYKFRVYVVKGTYTKDTIPPYSSFGMGSVEIDVVNSNLLDFNVAQDSRVTVNEDGTLTINGTGGFGLNIDKLQLKAGITYYQKVELISGSISGSNINNTFLSFAGAGAWISSENFSQTNLTKDTEKTTIWINASAIFNNAVIRIWANIDKSDFVKHQSQTAIMPIQQEMLEGDYIKDVEHHEWQKFIFDGVTNRLNQKTGTSANNLYYTSYISNLLAPTSNGVKIEICSNCFKSYTANQLYGQDLVGVAVTTGKSFSIGFGLESSIDTLDKANEKLKELYDAGTPIIIYYKLAEAIDLELTSKQKAVRNQKLYTYKNITNIDVSDELASIDVEYKKDPTTEHDDLQNQIDEIKQLLSTTETSAFLVNNLEKELESEVN